MKKLFLFLAMGLCAMAWAFANVEHVVEPGETLKSIAQKYGVTEAKIIELNPDAAQFIYVGMELNIPANAAVTQSSASTSSTSAPENHSNLVDVGTGDRLDSDGNIVKHSFFAIASFQAGDLDMIKESGSYGLGMMATSIS
ncbi:MAG: LysM peptidoglycan-binding domain-containing protein, partial [Lachnospiraceae bacterium]|nr:LysM peptidoglycan-binding domain-containing protein [Lachnospiraceae bacterium]